MTDKQLDLITKTIAINASKEELETLLYLSREYNLDPIKKEIYFIKYGGKSTIITSRDGYLKIANSDPNFDGMEGDAVYIDDILTKREDGSIEISYGASHLAFDKTKLTGAFCNVWRKDRSKATTILVSLKDYFKKSAQIWEQYTSSMILKVAESMALKRAFTISGLATAEELDVELSDASKNESQKESSDSAKNELSQEAPQKKQSPARKVFKASTIEECISQDEVDMINQILGKFPEIISNTKLENIKAYYNITDIAMLPKAKYSECYNKLHKSFIDEEEHKRRLMEKSNG